MKSIDIMSLKSFFSDPSLHSHRHHLFSVRLFFFYWFLCSLWLSLLLFFICACMFMCTGICGCRFKWLCLSLLLWAWCVCFFFRHSILQRITTHFNLIVILKVLLRAAQPSRQSLLQCTCRTCEFK